MSNFSSERFRNQQPFIATEKDCCASWGGGFWCALCGKDFEPGDSLRIVLATHETITLDSGNVVGLTNFKVCAHCDGEDVLARWKAHNAEFYSARFKTLRRNMV